VRLARFSRLCLFWHFLAKDVLDERLWNLSAKIMEPEIMRSVAQDAVMTSTSVQVNIDSLILFVLHSR
jgi:hypothetical protein